VAYGAVVVRFSFSTLAHLQRVDADYETTDFNSFRASLDYFADLTGSLPASQEVLFRNVAALAERDESVRAAAHATVYDAAEEIHEMLVRSKGGDMPNAVKTLRMVLQTTMSVYEALGQLLDASEKSREAKATQILDVRAKSMKERREKRVEES
jgi:hypothetical protein